MYKVSLLAAIMATSPMLPVQAAQRQEQSRQAAAQPAPVVATAPPTQVPQPSIPMEPLSDPVVARAPAPAILRMMQSSRSGMRITALGKEGGLSGYMVEQSDGKVLTLYVTPDGNGVVIGTMQMLTPDGKGVQNVTTQQWAALKGRMEELRRRADDEQRVAENARRRADQATAGVDAQQRTLDETGRKLDEQVSIPVPEPVPGTRNSTTSVVPVVTTPPVPVPSAQVQVGSPIAPPLPEVAGTPAVSAAPAIPPAVPAQIPSQPQPTPLPGPRSDSGRPAAPDMTPYATGVSPTMFLDEMEHTAFFRVGSPSKDVPVIYMLVDPKCPHCHAAWAKLKPMVDNGRVTLRIIMIGVLEGSEELATRLLSQQNPASAWSSGQGSEEGKEILPGAEPGSPRALKAKDYLAANMAFVRRAGVTGTPWMAYVGRDGKVYKTEGDRNLIEFLGAL